MAHSVNRGFSEYLEALTPRFSESEEACRNFTLIERCLTEAFQMSYMVPFGSTGHGTNVVDQSAIDCFAVIRSSRLEDSADASLGLVHRALAERFAGTTVLDGRPFISVPFGGGASQRHNVVPAYPIGKSGDHEVFGIPGPSNRWIEACPGGHSAWLNNADKQTGKQIKPFVRLAKAWNFMNGRPIWSFYLELRAVEFCRSRSSIHFSSDLMMFFEHLAALEMAPMERAAGSNEPVYGTSVEGRQRAMEKVEEARDL